MVEANQYHLCCKHLAGPLPSYDLEYPVMYVDPPVLQC